MEINIAVPAWKLFDKETMVALGLPEMCTKVVITAEIDSAVTIDCTYFAPHLGFQERLKRFILVERGDEPIGRDDDEPATDPDCSA